MTSSRSLGQVEQERIGPGVHARLPNVIGGPSGQIGPKLAGAAVRVTGARLARA